MQKAQAQMQKAQVQKAQVQKATRLESLEVQKEQKAQKATRLEWLQVLLESLEEKKKKAPEESTSPELIQVRPTDEKVHTYSSPPLIIHPSPRLIIVTSHRAMDIPTK